MSGFSKDDSRHMAHALRLARRGRYSARPNPCVGCVIVRDGDTVGEGWHEIAGGPHAEIAALADAGDRAGNATVYVTLEPCVHHGKTPPCTEALIAAGVARVVAAMSDPFPEVSGSGLAALQTAGIRVESGLLEHDARDLNAGYLSRVEHGKPFVRLKVATSLDGGCAMNSGESQWITGAAARADVQRLRALSGAVLTGVDTVVLDNPSLNVREAGLQCDPPTRVIADSRLRTPPNAKLLGLDGETLIYCIDDDKRQPLERLGVTIVTLEERDGRVSLPALLRDLAEKSINTVLVESGPTLGGRLLADNLVDELVIYQAAHIMGSETQPMFRTPSWQRLSDRRLLDIVDVRLVGKDTRITARFAA